MDIFWQAQRFVRVSLAMNLVLTFYTMDISVRGSVATLIRACWALAWRVRDLLEIGAGASYEGIGSHRAHRLRRDILVTILDGDDLRVGSQILLTLFAGYLSFGNFTMVAAIHNLLGGH